VPVLTFPSKLLTVSLFLSAQSFFAQLFSVPAHNLSFYSLSFRVAGEFNSLVLMTILLATSFCDDRERIPV
jgi:hypothetical protein